MSALEHGRPPLAHASFAAIAISIVVSVPWLLYQQYEVHELRDIVLLAPTPDQIIRDHLYWGVLTATFIHLEWLHLIFNMLWMWRLSPAMEAEIGSFRWLGFFLAAAVVTCGFELTVGGWGLGMSGVSYAIFGFMWQARRRYRSFDEFINPLVVKIMLAWIVLCYVMTWTKVSPIANTAHLTGLGFGYAVAWSLAPRRLLPKKLLALGLAGAMVIFSVLSLTLDLRLTTVFRRLIQRARQAGEAGDVDRWQHYYDTLNRQEIRNLDRTARALIRAGRLEEAAIVIDRLAELKPEAGAQLRAELAGATVQTPPSADTPRPSRQSPDGADRKP